MDGHFLFIIGAGASQDISLLYPSGGGLKDIVSLEYLEMRGGLQTDIIDFLGRYPTIDLAMNNLSSSYKAGYEKTIKDLINRTLIDVEREISYKSNYFAQIIAKIIGHDKIDNLDRVDIKTFNYDLALERTIYEYGSSQCLEVRDKLKDLSRRIEHFYGMIGKDGTGITFIRDAECGINFSKCSKIYFLGFGFDEKNCENIGLKSGVNVSPKAQIYITNYSDPKSLQKYGRSIISESIIEEVFGIDFSEKNEHFCKGKNKNRNISCIISHLPVSEAIKRHFTF